ncbi:MAG TPA: T9SS type A sorting domain-containing protein, partial [Bacteroidia bacterium]|nr:T9SS type A sorting domain-containing protein [Bacteroidia bacterium]
IILSGNTLYGMTALGGSYDSGIIFGYVDTAVGINELKVESEKLNVYPNPSNGLFTIQSPAASGQSSVQVYNMLGQQVYSQYTLPNTQYQIDISNQPTGIYFYRLISENGNLIGAGKLVVE